MNGSEQLAGLIVQFVRDSLGLFLKRLIQLDQSRLCPFPLANVARDALHTDYLPLPQQEAGVHLRGYSVSLPVYNFHLVSRGFITFNLAPEHLLHSVLLITRN